MWSLDVTWQSINVMSSLPQELQALILAEWWLSLKVFLLPSHMSLWSFDHYILFYKACEHQIQQSGDLGSHPTVTWPLINLSLDAMWQIRTATYQLLQELLRVLIKGDGLPPIKSYDLFLMWSDEVTWQIKIFISPFPPKVSPPNFQGSRFRMRGSQLPSHITT